MTIDATPQTDILELAERVLETGEGLAETDILRVLQAPDDQVPALLDVAHRVRMQWCGPRSRWKASSR